MKEIQAKLTVVLLGALLVAGGFVVATTARAAWVEPDSPPPGGGNVAPPLNVSDLNQIKQGALSIGIGGTTPVTTGIQSIQTFVKGVAPDASEGTTTAGIYGEGGAVNGDRLTTRSTGVYAVSADTGSTGLAIGLMGVANGVTDNYIGVYGLALGGSSYAGYFAGKVGIDGQLCLQAGTDCINSWSDISGTGGETLFTEDASHITLWPVFPTQNVAFGLADPSNPESAPFYFSVSGTKSFNVAEQIVIGPTSSGTLGDGTCSSTEDCTSSDCAGKQAQCGAGFRCDPSGSGICTASDVTPPSAPGAVSYGTVGIDSVELSWGASSGDTGGCNEVIGYKIFRCTGSGCTPGGTPVGMVTGSATTTYTDTTAAGGTTYRYGVTAFDCADNESTKSIGADVTTLMQDSTPPTAPQNLQLNDATGDYVWMSWDASTDEGTGVAGYIIYRCQRTAPTSPCEPTFYFDTGTTDTQIEDYGVMGTITYDYQVSAYDVPRNESGRSNTLSVLVPSAGGSPIMSKPNEGGGGLRETPNKDIARITKGSATASQAKHAPKPVYVGTKPLTALLSIPQAQAKFSPFIIPTALAAQSSGYLNRLQIYEGAIRIEYNEGSSVAFMNIGGHTSGDTTLATDIVTSGDLKFFPGGTTRTVAIGETGVDAANLNVSGSAFVNGSLGIGATPVGAAKLAVTGGNVGIGTDTPGQTLEVLGPLRVSLNNPLDHDKYYLDIVPINNDEGVVNYEFQLKDSSHALTRSLFLEAATGYVGIGTIPIHETLRTPLDVRGNASVDGALSITGESTALKYTAPTFCTSDPEDCITSFSGLGGGGPSGSDANYIWNATSPPGNPPGTLPQPAASISVSGNIATTGALAVGTMSQFAVDVSGNLTTAGDLHVDGNTIIGNATGDTLTLNVGTVTIPSTTTPKVNFADTFVIDAANNRVGIGTATPSQALDVNGTTQTEKLYAGNGAVGSPSMTFTSDTDTGMYRSAANEIGFATSGAQRLYISDSTITTGNRIVSTVPVGTAPLTIASNTKVDNLNADLLDDLDSTAFELTDGTDFIRNQFTDTQTASFKISDNGWISKILTVGEQINLPSLSLPNLIDGGETIGGIEYTNRYAFGGNGTAGTEFRMGFFDSGVLGSPILSISDNREVHLGDAANPVSLCLYGGGVDCKDRWGGELPTTLPALANYLTKFGASAATVTNSALYETDGRVGIGTTSPSQLFTVVPPAFDKVWHYDGSTYNEKTIEAKTTGGTPYTVLANTNNIFSVGKQSTFQKVYFKLATVGVGLTITPASVTYWNGIDSSWTPVPDLVDGTANLTQSGTISFTVPGNWAQTPINGFTAYWVRIRTTESPTTPPTAYFTVPDDAERTAIYANAGDATPAVQVNKNGNVGIGTTNPATKLEVAGGLTYGDANNATSRTVRKQNIDYGPMPWPPPNSQFIFRTEPLNNGAAAWAKLLVQSTNNYSSNAEGTKEIIVNIKCSGLPCTNTVTIVPTVGSEKDVKIKLQYNARIDSPDIVEFYIAATEQMNFTETVNVEGYFISFDATGNNPTLPLNDVYLTSGVSIKSNGNVGIGQTNPVAKFVVNNPTDVTKLGSANDAIYAYANAATGAAISGEQQGAGYAGYFSGKVRIATQTSTNFDFSSSVTSGYSSFFSMDDTGLKIGNNSPAGRDIEFQTGSPPTTKLTILTGGNVGIGTSSPLAPLDLFGGTGAWTTSPSSPTEQDLADLSSIGTGAILVGSTTGFPASGTITVGGYITFEAMSYTVVDPTHLNITARAQLGTTGVTHASAEPISYLEAVVSKGAGTTPNFAIASNGAIGINGIPYDGVTLHNNQIKMIADNVSPDTIVLQTSFDSGYDGAAWFGTQSGHSLVLQTADTGKVLIDPSGNVGIGTFTPEARLAVGHSGGAERITGTNAIAAYSNNATLSALYAQQDGAGYAGYFSGRVHITRGLTGDAFEDTRTAGAQDSRVQYGSTSSVACGANQSITFAQVSGAAPFASKPTVLCSIAEPAGGDGGGICNPTGITTSGFTARVRDYNTCTGPVEIHWMAVGNPA